MFISSAVCRLITEAEPAEAMTARATADVVASTVLLHRDFALGTLLGVAYDPLVGCIV